MHSGLPTPRILNSFYFVVMLQVEAGYSHGNRLSIRGKRIILQKIGKRKELASQNAFYMLSVA